MRLNELPNAVTKTLLHSLDVATLEVPWVRLPSLVLVQMKGPDFDAAAADDAAGIEQLVDVLAPEGMQTKHTSVVVNIPVD